MEGLVKLYTFVRADGGFVTCEGASAQKALARAREYHLVPSQKAIDTYECRCSSKSAKAVREAGWLICNRRECAGRIG